MYYPTMVKDAIMLAKNVADQGGSLRTHLGGNCPTIAEVIDRALPHATGQDEYELRRMRTILERR